MEVGKVCKPRFSRWFWNTNLKWRWEVLQEEWKPFRAHFNLLPKARDWLFQGSGKGERRGNEEQQRLPNTTIFEGSSIWCLILFSISCRGRQWWGNVVRNSVLGFGRSCPQEYEVLVEIGRFVLAVGDVTQFYKNIKLKTAVLCFPRYLWPPSVSSIFPCRNIRELLNFIKYKP